MELINWITSNPPLLPLMLLATILPPPSHVLQIDSIFFQEREFSGQPTINRQVCQKHVLVSNVLSPKCPLLRFSVSKMSWLCKTPCPWNFLSLKCPVSTCPGSVKRPVHEISCPWNVLFQMSSLYETSCPWNFLFLNVLALWNVLSLKCPVARIHFAINVFLINVLTAFYLL